MADPTTGAAATRRKPSKRKRRQKRASDVVLELPPALVVAIKQSLTPEQRSKLLADDAHALQQIALDAAGKVGQIVERAEGRTHGEA